MMEVEAPWRCRRTDGKKWRCKRNVVSDHKYCDRHMYRGRLRSRKPVEQQQSLFLFPSSNDNNNNGGRAGGVTIPSSAAAGETTAFPSLTVAAADSRVNVTSSNTQGLDFSPNSVLLPDESQRCRRTDGKKWRCRRDVVSNQKYCDRHLHRGSKRRPEDAAAASTAGGGVPPPTSQQMECSSKMLTGKDNGSTSSASSDATISEVLLFH